MSEVRYIPYMSYNDRLLLNTKWAILSDVSFWEAITCTYWWDDVVCFVSDQHAVLDSYCVSSLKRQPWGVKHVTNFDR